ncbi:hypothetical protein [Deinococcus arcticus]|nr:hypothetical protein [Deinococcus arcticus]
MTLIDLRNRLREKLSMLNEVQVEAEAYLALKDTRHDQLTRRLEKLERRTDDIANPDTARSQKLLEAYDQLLELHARSEEELDDWESLVLEPLREVQEALLKLVS